MKKIYFILCLQWVVLTVGYSQVIPRGMNYQAVARNLKGDVIPNQKISFRILLFGIEGNQRTDHYSETHEVLTDALGIFSLVVGEGVQNNGDYNLIPWNKENIWMEVTIKEKGTSNFTRVSSSKLQAVPYAIHAGTATKLSDKTDNKTSDFIAPPEPGVVSDQWSVFGNAKTDLSGNPFRVNSLGTTDFVDLIMITDNLERMRILSTGNIITKLNFDIGKDLKVGQNLYVTMNATIGDSLYVKKNVALNTTGGSTIVYGPFTVDYLSPTYLTGTLTVDKATDLNATLNVDGSTDLNGRLFVNNMSPTLLTGTLQVDSVTNLNDALTVTNMSPTSLSGTLRVDSCATFNDKVKIVSMFSTDTSGIAPSGSLQVGGGAYIKENFYVGGVAKFGGPVAFGGAVSITDVTQSTSPTTGALKVSGGVGIGLNLNVGGAAMIGGMLTIKDLTQSTLSSNGALTVFGGVGMRKWLNVGGSAVFDDTLNVTGITSFNNVLNVTSGNPFVADFVNTSDRNGISIQVNNSTPSAGNNFVEFRNGTSGVVGRIEGENQSEFMNNPEYIRQINLFTTRVTFAEITVASATIALASAVAGIVAAATSFTPCAGLGFCVTSPLISYIVAAAIETAARGVGLGLAVAGLLKKKARLAEYQSYKAARYGVTYESGAGDYAEWLPKLDTQETFLPGYIVGINNGYITKNTANASKLMVISTQPIVLGNSPTADKTTYEKVAFLGQVPIHVMGKVQVGDYILPSGNHDGMGTALSPLEIKAEDYLNVVGVAWTSSNDDQHHLINVAIGLNDGDFSKVLIEQKEKIKGLKAKFDQTNIVLSKLVPGYSTHIQSKIPEQKFHSPLNSIPSTAFSAVRPFKLNTGTEPVNYLEISNQQVLDLLNLAETTMVENGTNAEENPLWLRLKTEPTFKDEFIKNIQQVYKREVAVQLEKLKPIENKKD